MEEDIDSARVREEIWRSLQHPNYRWLTLEGIAGETGMDSETISAIVTSAIGTEVLMGHFQAQVARHCSPHANRCSNWRQSVRRCLVHSRIGCFTHDFCNP